MAQALARLLPELRACTHCEPALPLGARPFAAEVLPALREAVAGILRPAARPSP